MIIRDYRQIQHNSTLGVTGGCVHVCVGGERGGGGGGA